jgi:HK97 family phage prohead protease
VTFSGYASLFGIADGAGDIVMPGAFRDSIARRGGHGIRMLFQHDPSRPLGVWTDMREDARGLFVEGELCTSAACVRDIAALVAGGAIDGLSIGFKTVKAAPSRLTGLRQLFTVDLWEISLVTFPMLGSARVTMCGSPPPCGEGPGVGCSLRAKPHPVFASLRRPSPQGGGR